MAEAILNFLSGLIIAVIAAGGYGGIFLLMALESANIPIPSEIIMTFAGFLSAEGKFVFWVVVLVGALGNVFGSALSYALGRYGGRPFFQKYGRYMLVSTEDFDKGESWLRRHGVKVAFWSRLLPVVRTFISLPAGVFRVPLWPFLAFTFAGSLIWSAILAWLGFKAGQNWEVIHDKLASVSWFVLAVIAVAGAWWLFRHLRAIKSTIQ